MEWIKAVGVEAMKQHLASCWLAGESQVGFHSGDIQCDGIPNSEDNLK